MVGSRIYDLMYRYWAPWDSVGVRPELRAFLDSGAVAPASHPRAVDLGCGTGANVVHLAQQGFEAHGVDFSRVAVSKARARAMEANVEARFVVGDLTADRIDGLEGPFDVLIDFGTLDDLDAEGRRAMAATIGRLSRPGSVFLFWCFYASPSELPWMSFSGPSRMTPAVAPGEEHELFGADFEIRSGPPAQSGNRAACFTLIRKG